MPSDWHSKSLGDLLALQRGFDLPSQDRRSGPIPIMGSAGITGFHDKATTKGPGVVIGRSGVGSMGVTSFIDRDFWALNTTLFVTDFKGNDARFIYYLLSSINFRHLDSGSAQASLNRNLVYPVRVVVPPTLDEQKRIAGFLATVESRIDLLRQTNATLESIAQALFKSWFIDFDPVRAKAEGREPLGLDAATAALFPAEFEESALGVIPKGWRAGSIAELSTLNSASWTARRAPEQVAYVDLAGVKANCFDPPQRLAFADAPSRARRELRSGDTLVGTVRPGNRSFGYVAEAEPGLTGSTGFAVLSPVAATSAAFVYLAATRDENIERLAALADGGAYPAVRPELVHATACVLPLQNVLGVFHAVASPLLASIAANTQRARVLVETRDTLLPRLISGKLRLPEAQAMMESTP
jgi:type I restriction enzyme S subunit